MQPKTDSMCLFRNSEIKNVFTTDLESNLSECW